MKEVIDLNDLEQLIQSAGLVREKEVKGGDVHELIVEWNEESELFKMRYVVTFEGNDIIHLIEAESKKLFDLLTWMQGESYLDLWFDSSQKLTGDVSQVLAQDFEFTDQEEKK